MTYDRLKTALEQIAAGAPDPAAIATEALRDRRPVPKTIAQSVIDREAEVNRLRSIAATDRAIGIFGEWIGAGRPPYARIATNHGVSAARIGQLVEKGRRLLLHPARKDHPLRGEAVKALK